jgi:catechol 2,3-dioxygenase-like lactoylglutathione lyase family enzyme
MRYRHTNLIARDWQALSRFYEQVFGCVRVPPERDLRGAWLERGTGVPRAHLRGVHLALPGAPDVTLEIFQYDELEAQPPPVANRTGFMHLAFEVADVERVEAAVLAAGGSRAGAISTNDVPGVGTLTFTYVRDPEGNLLEVQHWHRPNDEALDGRVHHAIIDGFITAGHAPRLEAIATAVSRPVEAVKASLQRLHEGHGVVLHPGSHEVYLAHPFSASPTGVWVEGPTRGWWAPCVWCAFGIVTLAAPTARVHLRLGGEATALVLEVRDGAVLTPTLVHFARPPREAWNHVVHWCAMVLPYETEAQVDAWATAHDLPRGVAVPAATVMALARAWYGRHHEPTWRKWTNAEAQAIFEQVGLSGPFFALPRTPGVF